MALQYDLIHWTPFKKKYDLVLVLFILAYLLIFSVVSFIFRPSITPETVIIRSTGSLALMLLHLILSIGPLTRMDSRFLPLLYNRRHLGVTLFLIALIHGIFNIIQFHSLGDVNPFLSLFTANNQFASIAGFPFQILGFMALLILAMLAATSHDFWLKNLGPATWKKLHLTVYVAYVLIILHVVLGTIQFEKSPLLYLLLLLGVAWLSFLHLVTGIKENKKKRIEVFSNQEFIPVCSVSEIPLNRAKMINVNDQKIAVFRYENKISAVQNHCKHQHGPLSEGKIIDGCITCPWHGYQYLPHNGQSPAPFTEMLATYKVMLSGDQVFINPNPLPDGTECTPAIISK